MNHRWLKSVAVISDSASLVVHPKEESPVLNAAIASSTSEALDLQLPLPLCKPSSADSCQH